MMRTLFFRACTVFLAGPALAAAPAAESGSWPHWRGAAATGAAVRAEPLPESFHLRVRWHADLGSGYSGVVVADGVAVTMFSDGRHDFLGALDADSGEERWRAALAPTYAGREGAVDGPVSTPAIAGGLAYGLGPRGDLVAADLRTGEIRWRTNLVKALGAATPHWGFTTSPLVVDDRVVVLTGGEDGRLATAFDAKTGEPVWSAGRDAGPINYSSPVLATLAGRRQIVGASDTTLFGFDPADGHVLWRHEHGGEAFFARIINPVVVDGERLFLNLRRNESEMIRVTRSGEGFEVASEWVTPELRRNYATPIYHDGYLYGLDGTLLSCVNAADGSRAWHSRTAGDSWPIVAGDRLITLTKSGTLHVLRATPAGFEPQAELQMFEHLVWTPPSYARGRIYGRDSFARVASVEIVRGTDPTWQVRAPAAPPSDFATWLAGLDGAPDREQRIRRFLDESRFPLIENERVVHLIYHGTAQELTVVGDMFGAREQRRMERVPGIDGAELFHTTFELEPDARVEYQFVRDMTETLTDPLNPRTSASLFYTGETSLLLMPHAADIAIADELDPEDRTETLEIEHAPVQVGGLTWGGGTRNVRVYLPPGYDTGEGRYPTVYVLYGGRMLQHGKYAAELDRAIGRSMQPVIAVFVDVMTGYEYARLQRGVHGRWLVEELVPRIDASYRTRADAGQRVIAGGDEGGYAAVEVALRYPHVFGNAAAQSIRPIGAGDRQMLDTVELLPDLPVRVAIDWGRYDFRDPRNDTDVPGFCSRLRDTLAEQRYVVTGQEWGHGPDYRSWTRHSIEALERWFPPSGAATGSEGSNAGGASAGYR